MGTRQTDEKYGRRKNRRSRLDQTPLGDVPLRSRQFDTTENVTGVPPLDAYYSNLMRLLSNDEGRLVICPTDKGNVHWYWKWKLGEYAGFYVYWFQPFGASPLDSICGLADKVDEVYRKQRKPVHDVYGS